ncbi:DUF3833 domain-containing protein [Oceanibaculum pacificum]|nr:DUF3833 domain-containing protein [Oceanibaculum pacificum]
MFRATALLLAALLVLGGCSTMKPEDFADTTPRLTVEDYFQGKSRAWGIFQDRFGTLRRSFTVDIEGYREGDEFVLKEDFVYDDGETDQRIWRIRRIDEHRYEGRADDVVGTATGLAYGKALNWQYEFDLKVGERTIRVHFDDWMFQQDEQVMVNRASVTKWGIEIGEVTLFFMREGTRQSAAATGAIAAE